ncbi:hypothetical protein HDU93_003390, partial [Gonapodya sp. JEL0774]
LRKPRIPRQPTPRRHLIPKLRLRLSLPFPFPRFLLQLLRILHSHSHHQPRHPPRQPLPLSLPPQPHRPSRRLSLRRRRGPHGRGRVRFLVPLVRPLRRQHRVRLGRHRTGRPGHSRRIGPPRRLVLGHPRRRGRGLRHRGRGDAQRVPRTPAQHHPHHHLARLLQRHGRSGCVPVLGLLRTPRARLADPPRVRHRHGVGTVLGLPRILRRARGQFGPLVHRNPHRDVPVLHLVRRPSRPVGHFRELLQPGRPDHPDPSHRRQPRKRQGKVRVRHAGHPRGGVAAHCGPRYRHTEQLRVPRNGRVGRGHRLPVQHRHCVPAPHRDAVLDPIRHLLRRGRRGTAGLVTVRLDQRDRKAPGTLRQWRALPGVRRSGPGPQDVFRRKLGQGGAGARDVQSGNGAGVCQPADAGGGGRGGDGPGEWDGGCGQRDGDDGDGGDDWDKWDEWVEWEWQEWRDGSWVRAGGRWGVEHGVEGGGGRGRCGSGGVGGV